VFCLKLVKAITLSKITMWGIKQNLFWAFIYNIVGIPLGGGLFYPVFGWLLNPVFAGLAMAFSSVSVVINSLRIKAKKLQLAREHELRYPVDESAIATIRLRRSKFLCGW